MKFEVFHYVYDNDGWQDKFTDLVLEKPFIFSRWHDATPDPQFLPLKNKNPSVRVKLSQNIKFGDVDTQNEYKRQSAEFEAAGKARARREFPESEQSFSRVDTIDGFKPLTFTFLDSDNSLAVRPRWMKRRYYLLASIIGLTWFYRLAFKRSTQKTACRITKTIYLH